MYTNNVLDSNKTVTSVDRCFTYKLTLVFGQLVLLYRKCIHNYCTFNKITTTILIRKRLFHMPVIDASNLLN